MQPTEAITANNETQMKLQIIKRNGDLITEITCKPSQTVKDIKEIFNTKTRPIRLERQYYTFIGGPDNNKQEKIALKDNTRTLESYGVADNDILTLKDIGPQISWKTVFLVEYFGPILIHSIFFFFPRLFHPSAVNVSMQYSQTLAYVFVMIHYLKREFETIFIHRFSNATMPLKNIFKNSLHYWVFGGVLIAYYVYHPKFTQLLPDSAVLALFVCGLLCQCANFYCHWILRNLRAANSTERKIPRGFLFEYVSCPNYFFEIVEWLFFSVMVMAITSWVFVVISAAQMYIWAIQKHKRYMKEFDGKGGAEKYPKRKALVPFLA